MKNNSVNKLVEHLQHIYHLPGIKRNSQDKIDQKALKQSMSKEPHHHWKANGVVHQDTNLKRLPIGDLDNWQILRINMSKRSYEYPRNYKGIKISAVSRQFNKFNGRGKNGQIPYLYESEVPRIQNLRQKIYTKPFKRTNTVRHEIFGFKQKTIPRSKSLFTYDKSHNH